jgi:hypothetical protein
MNEIESNKSKFLNTMNAVIIYFDPEVLKTEDDLKVLQIANETVKIETDRLKKSMIETRLKIEALEGCNNVLCGNLAFIREEIDKLEKENCKKIGRIDALKRGVQGRKEALIEAQGELDLCRRNEVFISIAEKRSGVGKGVWDFSFRSDLMKEECGRKEDQLEKALSRLQKINENLRFTKEQVKGAQFRLGIEMKDKGLSQSKIMLGQGVDKRMPSRRPTTAIIRTKVFTK